ncbi:4-hydroxyphenylpyruvate dioxygenase [Shewanella sp. 1_MG-2023]|uniref:4-hydroxyphenylpyruvate dioxygenase n=1 Tax=Shewanella electrodiphila TaxID=934143 RepID=A0ABT0KR42_9GAMM|nr:MULTISPECIES: 4-hydroxyphenylpyruvate dioxygenase [Shewanella]MCL1045845.1 4-hydroxyphenylpyruvate dioxygenase [Shewanella electrodiphila]MDO6610870.1 4-hydroxyphenylpyruvate dioxygenase [Shewanella sp. 7_MG-2023]MDO6770279.1 4-hydroxyphenylpyruvate dioxygenase [Shewanella sp. 2_MG-2023]MDO6793420.1 4-hydroxyphenylpyruvate dioxygenase [Shewanella sp. 1_MG-2023]PMG77050.1 4-hydroxyphenylpyruvate dioxygenase [Shewanella sp. 10N.286.51.B7]
MASETNPLGLLGIEFTEFASPDTDFMHQVFIDFGFSMLKKAKANDIVYYKQNDINFLLNKSKQGFSADFAKSHGPAICSMGWRVEDAEFAFNEAVARGAKPADDAAKDMAYPAIYGIGDSLIYFIDVFGEAQNIYINDFEDLAEPMIVEEKGFMEVDHLTNNVYKGTMEKWANFYKDIFAFTEVRYFDISGAQTALVSYALRSPDGSFCIPINEGKGNNNNQIDEYLGEYNGPGVQHLAFRSRDIVGSLDAMEGTAIKTLDIIPEYYDTIFDKLPQVTEDHDRIKHHQILVDGDDDGYLLQIFTKNLFGPIFIEIIQRKNNLGFGEGNFKALFESIERDQMKRGVL